MKTFAFYLPQFHEITENNMWWGDGFTEWTNVKKANSLYNGHIQPIHPLNNNYYNLLDKETIKWQTSLLNMYNINGLIYYHYYFKGKKLLEKPAENLLMWKDIKQQFFFCWANHDWIKSWNGTKEVLIKQEYGTEIDWENHFQYLLPFFQDERYEKKDNMPLLMLFECHFKEKNSIFNYFDKRCKELGFNGLYLIESFCSSGKNIKQDLRLFNDQISSVTKRIHLREPITCLAYYKSHILKSLSNRIIQKGKKTLGKFIHKPYVLKFNGNDLFELMAIYEKNPFYIPGLFLSWDNTPRHNFRGYVISPPNYEHFELYMNSIKEQDYLFINAWNEWAEGMILEPTMEYGYRYLEWIKKWIELNNSTNKRDSL